MNELEITELLLAAEKARERAVSPFSNFRVGAALQTTDGKVFTGCNIESASYGLTICAERVAIWKALSEGSSDFIRLAISADSEPLTPPCGACRQIIWEFCRDVTITLVNLRGETESYQAGELIPHAFDSRFLKQGSEQ